MIYRNLWLELAVLVVLATVPLVSWSGPRATRLDIEPLSRVPTEIRIIAIPPGLWSTEPNDPRVAGDIVVPPHATVWIADSVRTVHVIVNGFGAVRVTIDSMVSDGRDITFVRNERGEFRRIWTVTPLVP